MATRQRCSRRTRPRCRSSRTRSYATWSSSRRSRTASPGRSARSSSSRPSGPGTRTSSSAHMEREERPFIGDGIFFDVPRRPRERRRAALRQTARRSSRPRRARRSSPATADAIEPERHRPLATAACTSRVEPDVALEPHDRRLVARDSRPVSPTVRSDDLGPTQAEPRRDPRSAARRGGRGARGRARRAGRGAPAYGMPGGLEELRVDARRGEAGDRVQLVHDHLAVVGRTKKSTRAMPSQSAATNDATASSCTRARRLVRDPRRARRAPSRPRRTSPRSRTSRSRAGRSRPGATRSAPRSRARCTRPRRRSTNSSRRIFSSWSKARSTAAASSSGSRGRSRCRRSSRAAPA